MREDLCKACGEQLVFKGTMRDGGVLVCPRCDMGEGATAAVITDPEYGQPNVWSNNPYTGRSVLYNVSQEDDGGLD